MDRKNYMTTGEFARLMNITKETLFHYDDIGLLSPAYKAPNGYRYYSLSQISLLDIILVLRELDMSLSEIKQFIINRSPDGLLKLLDDEEAILDKKISRLNDRKEWIKEYRQIISKALHLNPMEISICKKPDRYYIYREVPSDNEKEAAKSISDLVDIFEKNNNSIRYQVGYVQYGNNLYAGNYTVYNKVILMSDFKLADSDYEVFPKGDYLTAYHVGDWHKIGSTYERIFKYAKNHKLNLDNTFIEYYILDRLTQEDEDNEITEISVRII